MVISFPRLTGRGLFNTKNQFKMNRKIKFRGQCAATGIWVYGLPSTETTLSNTISHISQFYGIDRKFGREYVKIRPVTVGQYTGLKDKNGKEIYEGDIVKFCLEPGAGSEDRKIDQSGAVIIQPHCTTFGKWQSLYCSSVIIIGNIHSNPELIK